MAGIRKRGSRWQVRWIEGGERKHVTVGTRKAAERVKVEIQDAHDRGLRYEPRRVGSSTPLGLVLTDYVQHSLRVHARATSTRYAQSLMLFQRFVGPDRKAEILSYQLLSDFHAWLQSPETGRHLHRRGPETCRKHIQAVELVWKWAWQRQARGDYVGIPQPDSLELKRQPPPRKLAPTWAQMDAMISAAGGWQRKLYTVLRCTGLRVGQAMRLEWRDLDLDRATLEIRPELGKSPQEKRGRHIPVAPSLVEELAGWGVRDGFLVPCSRDTREARARDAMRAWARAGVDERVWRGCAHHAFRSGFTTELKRAGADVESVEFLVGHADGVRGRYLDARALPLVETVELVPRIGAVVELAARAQ